MRGKQPYEPSEMEHQQMDMFFHGGNKEEEYDEQYKEQVKTYDWER